MLFNPEHVKPILSGEKIQTRRVWKRCHAKVGGTYRAKLKMLSRDYFARLKVTGIRQERLGDISEADAKAEGGYTVESYRQEWIEINGTWDPDQVVYVISFVMVALGTHEPTIGILVCGDRDWTDTETIRRELSRFPKGTRVIHGAARGADEIAGRVATELEFEVIPFSADWPKYGSAAGPIRNQEMLESLLHQDPEEPKLVLAFHRDLSKSKGTADMVKRARSAGVKVRVIS